MAPNETELCLKILQRELCAHVSESWYSLGLELGVPEHILKNISSDFKSCNRQSLEMLKYWMKNTTPSWKAIVDALSKIDHESLSLSIRNKYLCCIHS